MRTIPSALQAHLGRRATTLCRCWRLTRRDGVVLGFTDHDETIRFEATSFEARAGLAASEAEAEAGLAAGSREIAGVLSSLAIEEKDIAAGRYDGARVETFLVNWAMPEERLSLDICELGEVKRSGSSFSAELRGIAARLDRQRGRLYRRRCDAGFGDARCGIDGTQARFNLDATVAAVEAGGAMLVAVETASDVALFEPGGLVWTSGEAKGLGAEIACLHEAGDGLLRLVPLGGLAADVAVGDRLRLRAGCDKAFATCRSRFGNAINFRGFPHLPGNDAALAFARKDGRHDGSPVVP